MSRSTMKRLERIAALLFLLALFPLIFFATSGCARQERVWQCDYAKASPELKIVKRIRIAMKDGSVVVADERGRGDWVEAPAWDFVPYFRQGVN